MGPKCALGATKPILFGTPVFNAYKKENPAKNVSKKTYICSNGWG